MHDRLTFYTVRESPLHALNPLTKLTLVLCLIVLDFFSPWYWTPTVLILGVILPASFLGKVQREYLRAARRLFLPAVIFIFIMQSLFYPIGEQVIFQFWFLDPTVESVLFAYRTATRIFAMISAFTLLLLTTHPSDLMTDLTRRGLSGNFAYVIISTLQIIPQFQAKAATIIAAQRSRGMDTEGSFMKRLRALFPLVAPLVFGSLVEVEERAIAIEARGFTSSRKKTFLREVPDARLDKVLRWLSLILILLTLAGNLWLS